MNQNAALQLLTVSIAVGVMACQPQKEEATFSPKFKLIPADTVHFNNFVDCNMAEAWVGDTFRIFPGKYGEDPVWGESHELKFADGRHAEEAFHRKAEEFTEPKMPPNVPIVTFRTGDNGLQVVGARLSVTAELSDGWATAVRITAGGNG